MANYKQLKEQVVSFIKTNGNQEITGQLLQYVLINIINTVGENATFIDIATPSTNPENIDGNGFYIAGPGTYPDFNNTVVKQGSIAIFANNNNDAWVANIIDISTPNYYVLESKSTFEQTVQQIKIENRKPGMIISYKDDETQKWIIRQFIENAVEDSIFTKEENWNNIVSKSNNYTGMEKVKNVISVDKNLNPIQILPLGSAQDITDNTIQSINESRIVRISAVTDCHIWQYTEEKTGSGVLLPKGQTEYFTVYENYTLEISGTANIME